MPAHAAVSQKLIHRMNMPTGDPVIIQLNWICLSHSIHLINESGFHLYLAHFHNVQRIVLQATRRLVISIEFSEKDHTNQ